MTTITEDYVSFETAKLLKKKKFHIPTRTHYDGRGGFGFHDIYEIDWNNYKCFRERRCYTAPTLQMAMKWLREIHGLFISIGFDDIDYNWQVFDIKNRTKDLDPTCLTDSYAGHRKYEQACEAAIKYCLENLI